MSTSILVGDSAYGEQPSTEQGYSCVGLRAPLEEGRMDKCSLLPLELCSHCCSLARISWFAVTRSRFRLRSSVLSSRNSSISSLALASMAAKSSLDIVHGVVDGLVRPGAGLTRSLPCGLSKDPKRKGNRPDATTEGAAPSGGFRDSTVDGTGRRVASDRLASTLRLGERSSSHSVTRRQPNTKIAAETTLARMTSHTKMKKPVGEPENAKGLRYQPSNIAIKVRSTWPVRMKDMACASE
eukprot:scaffold17452_cov27-Tisochrysis_lutea.AAC.4